MQAGLYLHIPFCQKKCHYCDFYSILATHKIPDFLVAIKQELDLYGDWWPEYDSLYLGGGTPSLLNIKTLAELINFIKQAVKFTLDSEWSIEINPDDASLPYLQDLCSIGFNRLSLGVQSTNDDTLIGLGRRHTADQALKAIEQARQAGFFNLSLDLIYGLPHQSLDFWLKELAKILQYQPEHLSCYQLSFEPHTPFGLKKQQGLMKPISEPQEYRYFIETSQYLESAGYRHYEVSNYSLGEKRRCRHNQKYWQHIPYLGLGPSAHSFRPYHRHWNHRSLSKYCSDLHRRHLPLGGQEDLGHEELRLETLYFGLRTRNGLDLENFYRQFGQDLLVDPPGLTSRLILEKKLEMRGHCLCPTPKGLALADSLVLLW